LADKGEGQGHLNHHVQELQLFLGRLDYPINYTVIHNISSMYQQRRPSGRRFILRARQQLVEGDQGCRGYPHATLGIEYQYLLNGNWPVGELHLQDGNGNLCCI
jgi:hypothetical protein